MYIGVFKKSEADEDAFVVQSKKLIRHPNHRMTTKRAYDICLIQTTSIIEAAALHGSCPHGQCYAAVCMPQVPPTPGRHCWVAGYGITDYDNPFSTSVTLLEVGVNLFDTNYCVSKSNYDRELIDGNVELCAGLPDRDNDGLTDGGKDACIGDSGGPLVCHEDGVAVLYGTVSWGRGCGHEGNPGVYANVFALRDWISETIRL